MNAPHSEHTTVWHATLAAAELAEAEPDRGVLRHTAPDVAVVGGGIIGVAVAWALAEQGATVQLIEAQTLAAGASGASAGGIWPNDQGPAHGPGFQELAFESRDLWGRLSLRPGFDFDWRVNGFLNLNAERIGGSIIEVARRLQEQGYAVQAVDAAQIAALEPNLAPGIAQGLHLPSEAHLHPLKAVLSLARVARRHRAGISSGVVARRLVGRGSRIEKIETTAGPIIPRQAVICTGWNADWLRDSLSHPLPFVPMSGQMISTDPLPPLLKSTVAGKFLVLQLRTGEIVTGGSVLESDSTSPDPELSARIESAARELIPALGQTRFTRAWCGVRPGTPDGLPVIDHLGEYDNAWIAGGHFRNGVLLAPATARHLAEWCKAGTRPEALAPFSAQRFANTTEPASHIKRGQGR